MLTAWTLALGLAAGAFASDWPYWRGPMQDGYAPEPAPVTTFSVDGKNILWKNDIGGRTTPIVMNGRVFYIAPVDIDTPKTGEQVVCLDAETGNLLWQYRFNVYLTDIVENRVGWTSLVGDPETGNVYAHGTGGDMFCFDRDGKILWQHSMTEEFGRISGYGGRLMTPIVDEDRVIVSYLNSSWGDQGRGLHRYVAFDKNTGKVRWWAAPGGTPEDTTYATPLVCVIDGKRMLIAPNADGQVYGLYARTGETVWSFDLSKRGLNTSPVADGNYVYVSHSEENLDNTSMGRVVCINAALKGDITKSGEVWRYDDIPAGYASPALANGRLYVVTNSANLLALDDKTGRKIWEMSVGRVGKGSPVVTKDGVIYVGEQNGIFHILRDDGDKATSLCDVQFPPQGRFVDEIFGSPAIANGRVYFMTRYGMYCLGEKGKALAASNAVPDLVAEEAPAQEPMQPAYLTIEPAEITLTPGEGCQFTLRVYDAIRRASTTTHRIAPRGGAEGKWSVQGLKGELSPDGAFMAARDQQYSAGLVKYEVPGGLSATARVRIMPTLPISEDFENMKVGAPPPGWIGIVGKTQIAEIDGNKVLRKLAEKPSPPFMRIKGYGTAEIPWGTTVECDMYGQLARKRFKPEMGLILCRYEFSMIPTGGGQLRLETWSPVPRLRTDVPFKWDAETWYRVKLQVQPKGEEALVRAKVWPRDAQEPADWQIEITDPAPNRVGVAGVYGYSIGTTPKSNGPEVYYDNFKVYAND